MHGCRPETPAPVPVNTSLELWRRASPTALRIVIELAAVRWVGKEELGIEFLGLQPEHGSTPAADGVAFLDGMRRVMYHGRERCCYLYGEAGGGS